LLVTVNAVPISPILVNLMMAEIRSSEMSVLTRATRRHIPQDGIVHIIMKFTWNSLFLETFPLNVILISHHRSKNIAIELPIIRVAVTSTADTLSPKPFYDDTERRTQFSVSCFVDQPRSVLSLRLRMTTVAIIPGT
jgi:hypothetical protein